MRAVWTGLMVMALGAGVALYAAEPAPDSLVANMKALNTALTAVRTAVTGGDFAGVEKQGVALEALLKTNTAFWKGRKAAAPLVHAEAAGKAAGELTAAAKAKNEAGVAAAQKALSASCGACHTAHRERTPDGKYAIK
ncbi:MAG: hypothetical protein ABL971_02760 [Vicinamibacterales bacterium]